MESQLSSLKKAKGHVESLLLASGDDSESGTVFSYVVYIVHTQLLSVYLCLSR